MIKKIVGILFSLAVLAIIVFALLGAGSYRTMLPEELFAPTATATMEVE